MKALSKIRNSVVISQRNLAKKAGVSFRSLQLIEGGHHDPKLSTVEAIAVALGYPRGIVRDRVESIFTDPPDSIAIISHRLTKKNDEAAWKIFLFNFVDAFRRTRDENYVISPPVLNMPERLRALFTSTVETLCDELVIANPWWCKAIEPLSTPWYVAEVKSLEATALAESPAYFRKRNIFVLGNFLDRV